MHRNAFFAVQSLGKAIACLKNSMKMLRINNKEADGVLQGVKRIYKIIVPVEKIGRGRFSNTNLITYDEVNNFSEINFFQKTYYSAKEVLFPIRQTIFRFKDGNMNEVLEKIPPTIIFLRACDINAVKVMDAHFLGNDKEDIYYKVRREKVKFFLIECGKPFPNCFCVSMGTNRADDYSVFIRKIEDGYEVEVRDKDMEGYFIVGKKTSVVPRFVEIDPVPVKLPSEIPQSIFKNEIWQEYTSRCIACGRCNTSCPTCTCFTMQDIKGERRRIWSSCQVKRFSFLAGNHDFRIPYGDRMRYKVLHKISDFKKRTGINMCVGCGRCDDVCPEYISMYKCIEKINECL